MSTTDHTTPDETEALGERLRTRESKGLNWWQAITAGVVAATIVNLLILLIGRAAGASMVVVDGANLHEITATGVITSTVIPLVVGTLLAVLLARWWPIVIRLAQVIGAALALLTVAGPLTADTDSGTQFALALMHIVPGVAVVLSLEAVRRRIKASRGA